MRGHARLVTALLTGMLACSEGTSGGPAPVPPALEEPAAPATPPDPPATRRVVEQRNPYGNVAVTDNLLWDGDFEFRPSFPEQYGWLVGSGFGVGFGLPDLGTGSRCRSGIKCAVLPPGHTILGIAVAAEGRDLLASFWAFPDDGTCAEVNAALITQYLAVDPNARLEPVQPDPFDDGWCQFEAVFPARTAAAYLSIENQSATYLVVDDAVVRPLRDDEQQKRSGAAPRPLTLAEQAKWDTVRRAANRARLPRLEPESRGQAALSAHLRRLMR